MLLTLLSSPILVGMFAEVGVIEALLACYFAAKPRGEHYPLILRLQLYLSHYEALVVAMELINLDGVTLIVDIVAHLINHSALSKLQKLLSLLDIYLLLPLIARETAVTRGSLDSEPCPTITNAHTNSTFTRSDIALNEVHRVVGELSKLAHN